MKVEDIKKGTAVISEGPNFLWAVESEKQPVLFVDDERVAPLKQSAKSGVWTYAGTLSEKMVHTSKIYPGMKSDYWVYTPAQYDPKVAAALMV